MKKRIIIGLMTLVMALWVAGCKNTAHGMGKDIERTGEKIQDKTQ